MKTAIKRICQIISLTAMMMFVMIAMHVLLAGHDQGELDGKVENSQCSRKNKRGDVRMIGASISHEVKGGEQKVYVRPGENCPDPEMIAHEHQAVFQDEEGDSGEEYRLAATRSQNRPYYNDKLTRLEELAYMREELQGRGVKV